VTGRMFPFVTRTWNPLGGACMHRCVYCWARALCKQRNYEKYTGQPRIIEKEMKRKFKHDDFVFVQDMTDLFAENVPYELIEKVLMRISEFPDTVFLLLTKNPRKYLSFVNENKIPKNVMLGVTLETNLMKMRTPPFYEVEYSKFSKAPLPPFRILDMYRVCRKTTNKIFVSIEPVFDFRMKTFLQVIKKIKPWAVAVGYDNYDHMLPEPSLKKTLRLIKELEKFTTVYRKTIKKAWWELPKDAEQ